MGEDINTKEPGQIVWNILEHIEKAQLKSQLKTLPDLITFQYVSGFTILIHSDDPQSRPAVSLFSHMLSVRTHVRPHFSKSSKSKQASEHNVHYWRDCGSGLAEWIIDDICLVKIRNL